MRRLESCVLALALLAACGKKPDAAKEEHEDHAAHEALHGGEILDLGGGAAHLEVIHDGGGGNITVYVLGADMKTAVPVEAPVMNLVAKSGPVTVALTAIDPGADGKASAWKGSHEGLKAEPLDGRIRVKIGDRTYQSPLEGEGHDHK
jgi:hypothetical protein